MAAEAKFEVGDVIRMKKPHPCGSSEWEILRVGADFRLKCQGDPDEKTTSVRKLRVGNPESRGGFSSEMSGMRTPGNGTTQTG